MYALSAHQKYTSVRAPSRELIQMQPAAEESHQKRKLFKEQLTQDVKLDHCILSDLQQVQPLRY